MGDDALREDSVGVEAEEAVPIDRRREEAVSPVVEDRRPTAVVDLPLMTRIATNILVAAGSVASTAGSEKFGTSPTILWNATSTSVDPWRPSTRTASTCGSDVRHRRSNSATASASARSTPTARATSSRSPSTGTPSIDSTTAWKRSLDGCDMRGLAIDHRQGRHPFGRRRGRWIVERRQVGRFDRPPVG